MPAPHFPLFHAKGCLWFKWQWALFYEEHTYLHGGWKPMVMVFDSRWQARAYKPHLFSTKSRHIRNVKMKRRLVQANWDDYNAKGNGNGQ